MKAENRKVLDDNRHHHETLTKAGYVKYFNSNEREALLRVMREEFNPGANPDLWCGPCVSDFILDLYRRYDAWLSANPEPQEAVGVSEGIQASVATATQLNNESKKNKNHQRR